MMQQDKEFTPEESLQLIRSMIQSTRGSMSDRSHYFLLWGWAVLAGSLLQYYLMVVAQNPYHYYAWLVIPAATVVHFIFIFRDKGKDKTTTFIGNSLGHVWMALGISFAVVPFIFAKTGWEYSFPFYILLYGIGTFISGRLVNFKPLTAGGLGCLLLAAATPYLPYQEQILACAFAILISYIVPGHLLRNRYRKTKTAA